MSPSTVCQWISGRKSGNASRRRLVEDTNAGFVGRGAGLRGVVDEVIGEEFVE